MLCVRLWFCKDRSSFCLSISGHQEVVHGASIDAYALLLFGQRSISQSVRAARTLTIRSKSTRLRGHMRTWPYRYQDAPSDTGDTTVACKMLPDVDLMLSHNFSSTGMLETHHKLLSDIAFGFNGLKAASACLLRSEKTGSSVQSHATKRTALICKANGLPSPL